MVHQNDKILSIHQKIVKQHRPVMRCVYVLNNEDIVVGMITLKEIMKYIAVQKALPLRKRFSVGKLFSFISKDLEAEMIMRPALTIQKDTDVEEALKLLVDNNAEEVAVVSQDGKIIGDLNAYEILKVIKVIT